MSTAPTPPVADRAADIGPEWLSAVLSDGQRQVTVTGVHVERIGTGRIGSTYRLTIDYAPGSTGPRHLVAKLAAEEAEGRGAVADGYRKEVGFYTHLLPTVDVRTPSCWYSAISEDGTSFTLLLDDLTPARPGSQAAGCTPREAEAAVRNVAGLHAPRWCDRALTDLNFMAHVDADAAAFIGTLHVDATEQFVERYRDLLGPQDPDTLRAAAAATATWLTARPEPFAATHGDYRLDNLMFAPDGGPVAALDWQTLSLAPPLRDVAYFLGTSLDVEDRRTHEARLVRAYHEELTARGIGGYDAGRCFDDYRLGQLQGPLITVLGSEYATGARTPESDGMFVAMARRSCAAIRDLGPLDLLP